MPSRASQATSRATQARFEKKARTDAIKALEVLLVPAGYPRAAARDLYERGVGLEELAERLRASPADPASLERTHGWARIGRVVAETPAAKTDPTLSAILTVTALHVHDDEGRIAVTLQDAHFSPIRFVVRKSAPRFTLGARVRVTIEPALLLLDDPHPREPRPREHREHHRAEDLDPGDRGARRALHALDVLRVRRVEPREHEREPDQQVRDGRLLVHGRAAVGGAHARARGRPPDRDDED